MEPLRTKYLLEVRRADQNREVQLTRGEPASIGRAPDSDLLLDDKKVSRRHARLTWVEGLPCLTDLESANGTRLNGRPLPPGIPHTLTDGDNIQIGDYTLTWRLQEPEAPAVGGELGQSGESLATGGPVLEVSAPDFQRVFPLVGPRLRLGRDAGNDIVIDNRLVSRWHAVLEQSGDGYLIIDQGGANGLSDGKEPITRKQLTDGDVLWITAHISLTYRSKGGPSELPLELPPEPSQQDSAPSSAEKVAAQTVLSTPPAPSPPEAAQTVLSTPPAAAPPSQEAPTLLTPASTEASEASKTVLSTPPPEPQSPDAAQTVLSTPPPEPHSPDSAQTVLSTPPSGPQPSESAQTVLSTPASEPHSPDSAQTVLSTPPEPHSTDSAQTVLSTPPSKPHPPESAQTVLSAPPSDPHSSDSAQTVLSTPPPEPQSPESVQTLSSTPPSASLPSEAAPTMVSTPPAPALANTGSETTVLEPSHPLQPDESAFEAAVEELESSTGTTIPHLVIHLLEKTWEVPLEGDSYSIGREPGNQIRIDHLSVSRRHARLNRRGDRFVLRDLGSANGIWLEGGVNGRLGARLEERTLEDGDTLRIGRARVVFKAGFSLEDLTIANIPLLGGKLTRRRPVLIVPGIMGSELWLGSERLWPNPRRLFNPEMAAFPGDPRIEARALVKEVVLIPGFLKLEQYNRLGDYLEAGLGYERGEDLLEFPYDWRQDLRLSAERLAETLERWEVPRPVTIIAHSMGSLVSRYYVERLGGKDQVERLILLGGPHYGAPKMISTLMRGPGLLPFGLMNERLRALLASFPSGYQMIPTYACVEDQHGQRVSLLEDETWIGADQVPLLRQAREFRRALPSRSSIPTVSIFGYGLKTITKVIAHRSPAGRIEKMNFLEEAVGDGTVPAVSAVLRRSEIHPVRQDHGSLYVDNDVKMRLKLELTRPQER